MVVDTSALVAALAKDPPLPDLWTLLTKDKELHVPHLLDYEFRSALRGMVLRKEVPAARAENACLIKDGMPLVRHPETMTGERAWDLRGSLTIYDATYVALAEAMRCKLVTCDGRLARDVKCVEVEYVPISRS
jgi:predicted nucleic acid-binding protein